MKRGTKRSKKHSPVYERIREILESAKASVARSVNTTQVMANWLIGREIAEQEQRGKKRADYGEQLLRDLAEVENQGLALIRRRLGVDLQLAFAGGLKMLLDRSEIVP